MDTDNPTEIYLLELRQRLPESEKPLVTEFVDLYHQKLWHELSGKIEDFYCREGNFEHSVGLFEHFISKWAPNMNKIKFVQFALIAAKTLDDFEQSASFFAHVREQVDADSQGAHVLAKLEHAHFRLLSGGVEYTRKALAESRALIDGLVTVDICVQASYFRVSADYYKVKANFGQYYRNALLYLACVQLGELGPQEKVQRVVDLAIAAFLSDSVYNFGNLLAHPIIEFLKTSPESWLYELLLVFNRGDIDALERSLAKLEQHPVLSGQLVFLQQKIRIMSLMETLFRNQHAQGPQSVPFSEIAASARLGGNEIEHLVMSALHLGIIKGKIDQVSQSVAVEWVQPRYLGPSQLSDLAQRLDTWSQRVVASTASLVDGAPEIFSA